MQRLEVSGAVRLIYGSLGVKRLITCYYKQQIYVTTKLYLILTVHKLTICDYVEGLRHLL